MDDSDSSSLSSAPSSEDEEMVQRMTKPTGLDRYFKPAPKEPSPEPPKRAPSPPHEYTLADNDAIAFIVMFRSRFHDAFPKSLPHYGPQDIERGVSGELPDEQVERLLCALLGLVLNRKKDVERGHYGRALEDAVSANQHQWPKAWNGVNPLHGGKNFNNMTAEERLTLLKALVLWSLNASEVVQGLIKESYKQTRRDDDRNQPRSVQPWFTDQYRRKYWLIEGLEDSHFRIYRENDGKTAKTNTWFSVAGTIDEVRALADKFSEEHTSNSKLNADKLRSAIPRFEAGEEKRKRRDYRLARKAAFRRPEPGFSLYEGRTRGKRMKYTFSDDEDGSDGLSSRRSLRNSGFSTPGDVGPTVTASGRQVKSRHGGIYGESMLVDQRKELEKTTGDDHLTETSEDMPATAPNGRGMRTSRSGRPVKVTRETYTDGTDSESDEAQSSGKEWSGNEDEPDEDDDDEGMSDDGLEPDEVEEDDNTQESLVVQLRYRKGKEQLRENQQQTSSAQPDTNGTVSSPANGLAEAGKAIKEPESKASINIDSSTAVADEAKPIDPPQTELSNGVAAPTNGQQGQETNTTTLHPPPPPPPVSKEAPVQSMDTS
ncbi:hypothetical protein HRR83_002325 [Exophiala dermatitidis]|nr:hypothetical protein HRR75_002206 [Exophiala dermatitidis]KAJ4524205.1 hypothetical protein HRR74_002402 [Exophiala dermatitidis]KAJ4525523.1 hypothetical protein HRR73_002253 [Exophiala dermatitidis]KAJ4536840.1 hypothetical protein HRR76_004866 [Exophiala dermatitidis]KAJ4555559.1 hypothetical protein HRR77_001489 [Exophiala dermatitidis]